MMRLYLDTCSLQRPLDTKSHLRIALESEAVLGILALCEAGQFELVSSDILLFEIGHNPHPVRREYALETLSMAVGFVALSDSLQQRAMELIAVGFKPLDALHLGSAESAQADYFCTCDDRLLKKAKLQRDLKTRVVSPVELIEEINQ